MEKSFVESWLQLLFDSNLLHFMGEMFQEDVESRNVYWLERLMETSQLAGHKHCARKGPLE